MDAENDSMGARGPEQAWGAVGLSAGLGGTGAISAEPSYSRNWNGVKTTSDIVQLCSSKVAADIVLL